MANTPLQPYTVIGRLDDVEFRYYPEAIMATVKSPDQSYRGSANSNFRKLAGYIFGGNGKGQKIAMTAPVHMGRDSEGSSMSFVMPEGYAMDDLPAPSAAGIGLHKAAAEYVAVIRFGGYASDSKIESKKKELAEALRLHGVPHSDTFRFLGYNAPWDILFRRNEVIVSVPKEAALKFKSK
jgi:hypothetical protein